MPAHPDEDWRQQLNRIERALIGDEAMGQRGLVDRMGDAEQNIDTIRQERRDEANQKRGAVWVFTTVSAIAGAVGAFVAWLAGLSTQLPKP